MADSKKVKRLSYLFPWQILEWETYLSDMAGKGYMLQKINAFYAIYKKGIKSKLRFHIAYQDYTRKDPYFATTQDWMNQKEIHENDVTVPKWNYVTAYGKENQYLVYYTEIADTERQFKDRNEEYQSMIQNAFLSNVFLLILNLVLAVLIGMSIFLIDGLIEATPMINLLTGKIIPINTIMLIELPVMIYVLDEFIKLKMVKKRLHQVNHHFSVRKFYTNYKLARRKNQLIQVVVLTLVCGIVALNATLIFGKTKITSLSEAELMSNSSLLKLEDIEGETLRDYKVDTKYFKYVEYSTPFIDKYYKSTEIINCKKSKQQENKKTIRLKTECYIVKYSWIAKKIQNEIISSMHAGSKSNYLLEEKNSKNEWIKIIDVPPDGSEWNQLILVRGKLIMVISYQGNQHSDGILENLIDKFE